MRYVIGVDEAGRGPLAGPVALGFVMAPVGFKARKIFPGLKDCKQLAPARREEIYETLLALRQAGEVQFCVRYSMAHTIDRLGLTRAVRQAAHRGMRALAPQPQGVRVMLDGLLTAPPQYLQKTIIGGDEQEPLIMLASIVAKVRRDRLMRLLSRRYPKWGFEVHKGYGTKAHYRALRREGLCEIHRRSFCKELT